MHTPFLGPGAAVPFGGLTPGSTSFWLREVVPMPAALEVEPRPGCDMLRLLMVPEVEALLVSVWDLTQLCTWQEGWGVGMDHDGGGYPPRQAPQNRPASPRHVCFEGPGGGIAKTGLPPRARPLKTHTPEVSRGLCRPPKLPVGAKRAADEKAREEASGS